MSLPYWTQISNELVENYLGWLLYLSGGIKRVPIKLRQEKDLCEAKGICLAPLYQKYITFLKKKSLIQLQTEDNKLGTLVVVVHFDPFRAHSLHKYSKDQQKLITF